MTVKIKSDPDFTLTFDPLSAYPVEFCEHLWREPFADHDRESAQHCSQFFALAKSFENIQEVTGDICKVSL